MCPYTLMGIFFPKYELFKRDKGIRNAILKNSVFVSMYCLYTVLLGQENNKLIANISFMFFLF